MFWHHLLFTLQLHFVSFLQTFYLSDVTLKSENLWVFSIEQNQIFIEEKKPLPVILQTLLKKNSPSEINRTF